MPRYEFSEGTSNKFWQIELDGSSFTTTYGKIGTDGQSTTKDFKSAADAKKEYDKLVAEKTKKGYALAGDGDGDTDADNVEADDADDDDDDDDADEGATSSKGHSDGAATGAQRFELVEGSSSKFWEITLDGKSFTTTYGKIGTAGVSTTKDWKSEAEAQKEHDKLVAEKTKKGYASVGAGQSSGAAPRAAGKGKSKLASNPELEAAIVASALAGSTDPAPYLVYGDWLQSQGDPRGELIAVQSALLHAPKSGELKKSEQSLLKTHASSLLGPIAKASAIFTLEWHLGYVQKARVGYKDYDAAESSGDDDEDGEGGGGGLEALFGKFLQLPVAALLQDLTVGMIDFEGDNEYTKEIAQLVKHPPAALRSLFLGDFVYPDDTEMSWSRIGNASKLWAAVPSLRKVILQSGGEMNLGEIVLPEVTHFEVRTGGLSKKPLKAIVGATWPKIETLIVWFGSSSYEAEGGVGDIGPILDGKGMPKLTHLGLCNAEFTNALVKELPRAKVLPRLAALDLSKGTLTDDGLRAILAAKDAFKHLKKLDLSENLLADAKLQKELQQALAGVEINFKDQRSDDNDDEDGTKYVAVAE